MTNIYLVGHAMDDYYLLHFTHCHHYAANWPVWCLFQTYSWTRVVLKVIPWGCCFFMWRACKNASSIGAFLVAWHVACRHCHWRHSQWLPPLLLAPPAWTKTLVWPATSSIAGVGFRRKLRCSGAVAGAAFDGEVVVRAGDLASRMSPSFLAL